MLHERGCNFFTERLQQKMMLVVSKINTIVAKVKNTDCNEKSGELELQPNVYAAFLLNKCSK